MSRDPIKPTLESVEAEGRRIGEAIGRALTAAASVGALLPGQTPNSTNLNAAQRARHRSGPTKTEAEYRAAGLRVLKIRIPAAYLAKLDAICDDSGLSRAEQVLGMIDAETAELARLKWKRAAT